jgi:hypothetical protein
MSNAKKELSVQKFRGSEAQRLKKSRTVNPER